MATITFSVAGQSASKTISSDHLARLDSAMRAYYGVGSSAEAFDALAAGVFSSVRDIVLRFERDAAVAEAAHGVAEIDLT